MRWEHTNVCAQLRIIIREATARHCKCDGKHTNVCAQCKLRIIIREVTAWPLQMRRETHQRLCAHWKLRIIIREATAWPLQMRWEHQRVCPLQASNYYQRSNGMAVANATGKKKHQRVCPLEAPNYYQRNNGMAVGNATGNTPTCVPNLSSES
jgi:hypothetical protein